MAAEFQRLGLTVERHAHRALNTGLTNLIPHKIKQLHYLAVWSEFPISGLHVRTDRIFPHMSQLCAWARLCADVDTPFILLGSFGKKWSDPQLKVMIDDGRLHISHHRLCHFGLKVDNSQVEPSNTCFVAASTRHLPSHCCRCDVPKDGHKLDWNTQPSSSQDRLRLRSQIAISGKLIDELFDTFALGALRSAPDSTIQNPTSHAAPAAQCRATQQARASAKQQRAVTFFGDSTVPPGSPHQDREAAFPTEGRERQKVMQKARKLAGGTAIKRKFVVEDHFDDCGTDLSGLGPDIALFAADVIVDTLPVEAAPDSFAHNLSVWWLRGSEYEELDSEQRPPHARITNSAHEMVEILAAMPLGDDIVELAGGQNRNASTRVRRHFPNGEYFEIVASCDLNDPSVQNVIFEYLNLATPTVAIMAPFSGPFGPSANADYTSNYERWLASYLQAAPFGRFCGHVALQQDSNGRHFINQQPFPSWLYHEEPWQQLLTLPTVSSEIVHQCMTGKLDRDGTPMKDPIGFVANHPALLEPLCQFKCNGSHAHGSQPTNALGQMWTWTLASSVADGIASLRQLRCKHPSPSFPSIGVGPGDDEPSPEAGNEAWRGCPGCRWRRTKTDPSHNRVPDVCKYPLEESIKWECPGCENYKNAGDSSHTYEAGKCKFHTQTPRLSGKKRQGKHPREPSTPSARHPTADLQAQLPDGADLGAADEAAAAAAGQAVRPPSSSGPAGGISDAAAAQDSRGTESVAARPGRGPDLEPRVRRVFRDDAAGTPASSDWTRFDIGSSLRALRVGHAGRCPARAAQIALAMVAFWCHRHDKQPACRWPASPSTRSDLRHYQNMQGM